MHTFIDIIHGHNTKYKTNFNVFITNYEKYVGPWSSVNIVINFCEAL